MKLKFYHLHTYPVVVCLLSCIAILVLFLIKFTDQHLNQSIKELITQDVFDSFRFRSALMLSVGVCIPVLTSVGLDSVEILLSDSLQKFKIDVGLLTQWLIVSAIVAPDIALLINKDADDIASIYWFMTHLQSLVLINSVLYFICNFSTSTKTTTTAIIASILLCALHVVHYCSVYMSDSTEVRYLTSMTILGALGYASTGYVCYQSIRKYLKDRKTTLISPDNYLSMQYSVLLQLWLTGYLLFYILTQTNEVIPTSSEEFCSTYVYISTAFMFALSTVYAKKANYMALLSEVSTVYLNCFNLLRVFVLSWQNSECLAYILTTCTFLLSLRMLSK